jgi:outer membrane receptor for ferric coprogen and ferric-rhodotorulic acid
VVLSPFEVVADAKGYQATNTMSGTRLNSQLEDLGASISVITKEQMADLAMLDINDVFLYSGNTEGTGQYTQIEEVSGRADTTDATAGDPANANRIRGIGRANVSSGNFETSNRVPLDPIDTDGVEISRGPNASIFGLGNPSGTVNIIGTTANLQRNRSTISFRADSFDGWRSSLD